MRPGTLSAQQRRLLDRLLDQRGVGAGAGRIPGYPGDRAAMPTSFAQQRIWFFDRLQPAEVIYNVAGAARLTGRLDVAVLERCLTEVVRRHEVLRTTYEAVDNRPVQCVNPPQPVEVPVTDLRHLAADERDAAVREMCDVEIKRPFDLERGPMLRPMLMRLADDEHLLLMSQHHIATDGWSLNVLMREVSDLYAAFRAGQPSPLPELPIQYGDFAAWQRDWLTGDVLERQLAYWREKLADSRLVDVSTGLPRPTALTWVGGTLRYHLDAEVVRRLTALAESERATPYMALVAAQSVVLSRWSGQDDVVIGCPVANRNRAETADLIGCFVNELPLRLSTRGEPTYRDLLRQAREVCLGAYANQDVPFEKVVEAVNPERDAMSHAPLVRHQLGLHNEPQWRVELPELTFEIAALSTGTARFDLEVDLSPDPSGAITGMVYFSTDLYTDDVVRRLLDSLTAVITAAVADPDAPAWRLPVVGPDELARLEKLGASTPAVSDLDRTATVDALVAGRASDHPRAAAIVDGSTSVTYRDLDECANRLAHWLRHLGVGAGTPVPVCLPPSVWQSTAVLAVLKAGGAAVPVDPGHPSALVHAAIRATGARLVLTDSATVLDESVRLESLDSTVRVLALDTVTERIDGYPSARPDPVDGPGGPAFLTVAAAGSTVEVHTHSHHDVVRRLTWLAAAFGPGTGGAVQLGRRRGLDAGAWAPLWALAGGGQLVLTDAVDARADVLCCDVAELSDRLAAPGAARVAPRHVVLDGSHPWPSLLADLQRIWPEAATTVLCGPIGTPADLVAVPVRPGASRFGRPVAGEPLSIVDPYDQPVPAGVPGELRLGTELRTGLRARWLPDDGLEVLGPLAEATSIRRHRVELTEVAGVVEGHAEIERAVVQAFAPESAAAAPTAAAEPAAAAPTAAAESAAAESPEDAEGAEAPKDPELVAYVTLRDRPSTEDDASRERRLFETAYTGRPAEDDPVLNIAGWNSPQTGEHITANEMREWSDGTMRRILRLAPRHVLEVGCRTGSLLFRLAPRCESYTATDLSARALGRVRRHGDWLAKKADAVQLLKRGVDDFSGFGPDRFDTIVLDALVQYFPTVGFLERVLRGAAGVLRPGGHIFLGNVRSLPLLPAMHLSVKWAQEPPGTSARQLRRLVTHAAAAEEELACDPKLFVDMAARIPGVTGVWILPRAGRIRNELTLYRYDVVLRVGAPPVEADGEERDWRAGGLTPDAVRTLLSGRTGAPMVLRDLPDARLAGKQAALDLLDRGAVATVGELSEAPLTVAATPGGPADPAELAAVAAEAGFDTYVRQSLSDEVGLVDLVLTPHDPDAEWAPLPAPYAPRPVAQPDGLANDPVRAARRRTAVAALRGHVLERLPGYLVPAHVVVLDRWPLDRAGRLDRTALPRPAARAAADLAAREPRTDTERAIAKIWADALGVDSIGVHEDFFSLGGHSLLGAEVVELVRDVYEVDLPLGRLFEAPTVAAVAEYVDKALAAPAASATAAAGGIERIDRGDYQTRRARTAATSGARS